MERNIGDSYFLSIGHTFEAPRQNSRMSKKTSRTFWARVKEAMEDRGLSATQANAAKLIGIQQPSISDWNKPGGFPSVENAVDLALRLNVCVEWLFTERGPKRPAPTDDAAQRLWAVWDQLDDLTKGEIIGTAKSRAAGDGGAPDSKRA